MEARLGVGSQVEVLLLIRMRSLLLLISSGDGDKVLRIRSLKTARRYILYYGETYVNSRRSILAGRRHIDQSVVVCWKKANHRVGAGGAGRLLVVVG